MIRDSAMVTMESLGLYEITIAISNGIIDDPSPSPKMGVQMHPHNQLRDACCRLANMIKDIDKAAVCSAGCHYERSDVTF